MTPCTKHIWFVNKRVSYFGIKNVNAMLKCKVCNKDAYLGIVPVDKFDVRGDKVKTYYWEGEVPEESVK
jgi:hypothetical protein